MLKKYRIQKILKGYIALDTSGKEDLIKRLVEYGPPACPMVVESISKGQILLEDGRQILAGLFTLKNINDYILLLADPHSKIRELAKGVISEKGGKRSVPALLENFDHPHTQLRKEVTDLLKEHLDGEMVSRVAAFIKHESGDVSKNAVELLGTIGGPEAISHLMPKLKSDDLGVRRAVVKSLVRSRDEGVVIPLSELLLKEKDQRILKSILDFFFGFLKRGGHEGVVSAVKPFLTSDDLIIRQSAVDVLGKIATVAIIPDILALLKGSDVNVRRSVVDILNMIKDPRTGEVLIHCIQDKDWWVREIATEALLKISEDDDAVKKELLLLLSSSDENTRRSVAEYFNQIVYPPAYQPLLKLLNDEDWWVREKALTALGRIGNPDAIPHMLERLGDTDIRGGIPEALAGIGSEKALTALFDLLGRGDRVIRVAAIKALQKFDTPQVIEKIKRAVLDGEKEVSETALNVLEAKMGRRVSRYDIELEFPEADNSSDKKKEAHNPLEGGEGEEKEIEDGEVGFSGNLSLFSLGEVIQNLEASAKSGCLLMSAGKIFFEKGQLVHCEVSVGGVPEIIGTEALFELFSRKEGTFKFVADQTSERVTVTEPTMSLVLEAARRVDEKKR